METKEINIATKNAVLRIPQKFIDKNLPDRRRTKISATLTINGDTLSIKLNATKIISPLDA